MEMHIPWVCRGHKIPLDEDQRNEEGTMKEGNA